MKAATAERIDLDAIEKHLRVELAGEQDDERKARRHEEQATAARESAKARRLRIGGWLAKARGAWPERGPNAKGWGEFLRRVGITEDSALRYIAEARGDLPQTGNLRENPSGDPKPANVSGGSGEVDRGTFCTSKLWAERVGPWDLDPFSNPRSHIVSKDSCQLERGDDGLGDGTNPGTYFVKGNAMRIATETTRVWIQPPYSILDAVIAHYGHTRFCALLRLDSSTDWFAKLWERTQVIALAKGTREFFEAPPGVEVSTNPQPHALYYADPRDVTPAIYEACIVLTRYQAAAQPALQIVR